MADREFPATGPDPYFVNPEPIRHPHNHNFIAMKTARQGGHTRPRRAGSPSAIPDADRGPTPYPNLTRLFNLTLRLAGPYHPCGA